MAVLQATPEDEMEEEGNGSKPKARKKRDGGW